MRSPAICLLVYFLLVSNAGAQSPDDGQVQGDAYVNAFFYVLYRRASILQPNDIASLDLSKKSPYNNEFLLFPAKQGDQPYGVILLAEKLDVPTPHSPAGIRDATDMMDWIMRFRPEQHVTILSKKHFTSANGLVFDELDYTVNGGYTSALLTPVDGFLLTFRCNAQSSADLAKMTLSVTALQRNK